MTDENMRRVVCRDMCRAVREVGLESLESYTTKHGLKLEQVWRAPRGEGFKVAAASFTADGEDILVIAFRSTFGNDEWIEYTQKYWKRKFLPQDGAEPDTDLKVFTIWSEALDEVWMERGLEVVDGARDTLRGLIWRQLNAGDRVWLTGHSKGGAVATTAASRVLLGDSVVDADLPDSNVRRPEAQMVPLAGGPLSKLSVFTFNAPMAFAAPLAELYDARLAEAGGEHVRFEHRADRVRKLPPDDRMRHVGHRELEGDGVAQDTGVWLGAAIAIGGVLAALVSAGAKIANSH